MGVYDVPFWSPKFYDHKARWIHYFNQISAVAHEIRRREEKEKNFSVLEIGCSHGLVTEYLRKFGVKVTTLDIKLEYKPDILSSVISMPVADNSFTMSIACEILEHLPFEDFFSTLQELRRVTKETVFISVPDVRRTLISGSLKAPFLKEFEWSARISTFKKHPPMPKGAHQWEIGKRGYPVSRILAEMRRAGFYIRSHYVYRDTPHNHYFVLDKK